MIVVNIHDAKAKLSEYVEAVGRGERVLICKRNQPVAELRPVVSARTEPRPFGGAKGRLEVPAAFFEPLPDDVVETFYSDQPLGPGVSKVAERPPAYRPRRSPKKRR